MVLRLGLDDAFRGHELRRSSVSSERSLHRLHQGLTFCFHDLASKRLSLAGQTKGLQHTPHDPLVVARLLQIFAPLLREVVVLRAPDRGLIDPDTAHLGFECLVQEFLDLFSFHSPS